MTYSVILGGMCVREREREGGGGGYGNIVSNLLTSSLSHITHVA